MYRFIPTSIVLAAGIAASLPASAAPEDDSAAIVHLAVSGAGLALARWSLIGEELRRGQLQLASKTITPFALSYYFVCLPRVRSLKKVAAFRDWASEQVASFPAPKP